MEVLFASSDRCVEKRGSFLPQSRVGEEIPEDCMGIGDCYGQGSGGQDCRNGKNKKQIPCGNDRQKGKSKDKGKGEIGCSTASPGES